jgi:glycosyltransferase involved in cell wall biosynthesis
VNSLLNQNAEGYEIILVDDGSPDKSPEICDEFAKNSEIVSVIHKKNGGLVSARKAGAEVATGLYIANIDGDDWVSSDFIKCILEIIHQYQPDAIHFDSINVFKTKTQEIHCDYQHGYYDKRMILTHIYPRLIENSSGQYFDPAICDCVFRSDVYKKYQMCVDNSIRIGEDASCTKPIYASIDSLYMTDKCLYYYRINENSMTKGKKVFPLDYPIKVGKHLETWLRDCDFEFQDQIYRYVTHNLFVASMSAFYAEEPYKLVKERIRSYLENEYYKCAIENCKYERNYIKGNMARIALKYRLFGLMKLYNSLEKRK